MAFQLQGEDISEDSDDMQPSVLESMLHVECDE